MKRKIILVLSVILSLCLLFSLGCGGGGQEEPPQQTTGGITFINPPTTVTMGETKKLTYYVDDGADKNVVNFTSSNTNVVTIDNQANIEALNVGQSVITGTCGESTAQFTLTVVRNDGVPQFLFNNFVQEDQTINLIIQQKFNLSGRIFYNGRDFYDGEVVYQVDNDEIVSISNDGTLTALSEGEAVINITATWRGVDSPLLTKEIKVSVINDAQILLDDGATTSIKLFTKADFHGKEYQTSYDAGEAKFLVNGEDVTDKVTFELIENKSAADENAPAASIDGNNLITATAYGSARLYASYDLNGKTVSHSIEIEVERPVAEYSKTLYFSKVDGDVKELEQMFGESVTLTEAYQKSGKKLTLNANKITDYVLTDANGKNEDTLTLYTDDCGVKVNVISAYKVISVANDLKSLYSTSATGTVTGYFLLSNDIAYDSSVELKPTGHTSGASGSNFNGVLDGQGYTINYGVTKGGLFGQLSGTIKNVSLIVKSVGARDYSSNVMIAGFAYPTARVENVYAKYDIANFTPNVGYINSGVYRTAGLGFFEGSNAMTLSNVVLDFSNVTLTGEHGTDNVKNYGVIACPSNGGWYYSSTKNVYVIWGEKILHFYNGSKIAYAENDSDFTTTLSGTKTKLTGVKRYDTLAKMAEVIQQVGSFKITENGVTWSPVVE